MDIASPDKDEHLSQVLPGADGELPSYVKFILTALLETRPQMETLQEWCVKVSEENAQLKVENAWLKHFVECKIPVPMLLEIVCLQIPLLSLMLLLLMTRSQNNLHDSERRRSIVIYGIPELSSLSATDSDFSLSHCCAMLYLMLTLFLVI